jgi:hypothetical protein
MKLKSEFLFALLLMPLVAGADSSKPCMDALKKFTAPEVPALGSAETEVTPGRWGTNTTPAGLPGKGLAQHPMLYIGEGYNKISRQRWQNHLDLFHRQEQRIRRCLDAFQRQHSFHPDAISRRNYAGEKSCLALRLPDQHGSSLLPADWIGQSSVHSKWPAAEVDGHEHQDGQR